MSDIQFYLAGASGQVLMICKTLFQVLVDLSLQGSGARLDIQPPPGRDGSRSTLRMEDLGEGEGGGDQYRQYERKIDSLMTEVGSLKNEVK